jgi:hypothetical protein
MEWRTASATARWLRLKRKRKEGAFSELLKTMFSLRNLGSCVTVYRDKSIARTTVRQLPRAINHTVPGDSSGVTK